MLQFNIDKEINDKNIYEVSVSYIKGSMLYASQRHDILVNKLIKKLPKYHNSEKQFLIEVKKIKVIGSEIVKH